MKYLKTFTIFCCILISTSFFVVQVDSFEQDYISISNTELENIDQYTKMIQSKQEEILHLQDLINELYVQNDLGFDYLSEVSEDIRYVEDILIPQSQLDLEKLKEQRLNFIKSLLPVNKDSSKIMFYNSMIQRMISESEWRIRLLEQEIIKIKP